MDHFYGSTLILFMVILTQCVYLTVVDNGGRFDSLLKAKKPPTKG